MPPKKARICAEAAIENTLRFVDEHHNDNDNDEDFDCVDNDLDEMCGDIGCGDIGSGDIGKSCFSAIC